MELLKRDYLTVTDEGDTICMTLDTSHDEVRKLGQKMSEIRPGLRMDGKGWVSAGHRIRRSLHLPGRKAYPSGNIL